MTSVVAGGSEILRRLPGEQALLAQDFKFRPEWWLTRVDQRTGSWLRGLPEDADGRGYRRISRERMLAVADGTPGWQSRAMLAAYVWGTGASAFLVGRRARAFRDCSPEELEETLGAVVEVLHGDGPTAAYRSMVRGGPCYVKYFGPAFFTKFLYIADSSCDAHPRGALIMDRFVVKALNALHGWDEPTYGWGSHRYPHWLEIASEQAALAAQELERPVRTDEVELAYFRYGKTL